MAYGKSKGHVTVTPKGQTCDHNTLRMQYLETQLVSWRCYLATKPTISNYYLVCCDEVWSAILATAWLLV